MEIYRFLTFWASSRYYRGARKVSGKQKERLEEMFALDRARETGGTLEKSAAQILREGLADVGRTVAGGRRG